MASNRMRIAAAMASLALGASATGVSLTTVGGDEITGNTLVVTGVSVEETDPTVPAWAKAAEPPSADVDAQEITNIAEAVAGNVAASATNYTDAAVASAVPAGVVVTNESGEIESNLSIMGGISVGGSLQALNGTFYGLLTVNGTDITDAIAANATGISASAVAATNYTDATTNALRAKTDMAVYYPPSDWRTSDGLYYTFSAFNVGDEESPLWTYEIIGADGGQSYADEQFPTEEAALAATYLTWEVYDPDTEESRNVEAWKDGPQFYPTGDRLATTTEVMRAVASAASEEWVNEQLGEYVQTNHTGDVNIGGGVSIYRPFVVTFPSRVREGSLGIGWNNNVMAGESLAVGRNNTIITQAQFSVAFGSNLHATNAFTFIWGESDYGTHGEGTFNIKPKGGAAGVWIGDTTLAAMLASVSADLTAATNYTDSATNGVALSIANAGYLATNASGVVAAALTIGITDGSLTIGSPEGSGSLVVGTTNVMDALASKATSADIASAISTNNAAFVAAVTNCPVVLADMGSGDFGDFGTYGTLGALLAALAAAVVALRTGKADKYPFVSVTPDNGVITLQDAKVQTWTPGLGATVTIAAPSGTSTTARDMELVIDCSSLAEGDEPTVTWGTAFHPRTDAGTDFACAAGVRNVYYISEYAAGEFVVGGWQETEGGNA